MDKRIKKELFSKIMLSNYYTSLSAGVPLSLAPQHERQKSNQ